MGDDQWRSGHHESLDLPPGFRFHPTDEEIITYYLTPKVLDRSFSATAVGEVDLNKSEPWDLPSKAKMGEKEWYFYCQKDRKYPTGMRTNRATEAGYWKATGKDREIYRGRGVLVGMKKTLVFYKGRAPKGVKTNWVMHEYRLEGRLPYPNLDSLRSSKDEWAVCRVFHKSVGVKKVVVPMAIGGGIERSLSMSIGDDFLVDATTLPPLMDPSSYFATAAGASTSTASPPPPASSYFTSLASGFSSNPALHVSHFGKPAAAALPPPVFYQQMGAGAGPGRLVAAPASFAYAHSNDGGRSHDTGLSTEHNTAAEASSVVSASSAAAGVDVGGVWKY